MEAKTEAFRPKPWTSKLDRLVNAVADPMLQAAEADCNGNGNGTPSAAAVLAPVRRDLPASAANAPAAGAGGERFVGDDFLLRSPTARRLYHEHAAALPVIDYHSHLDPADLARDRAFEDLTELWVAPDQYKHRAMRSLGVAERFITGDAPRREKFGQWAASVPLTAGNPLYHWTALELRRYFGVDAPLNPATAAGVWEHCNAQLRRRSHTARQLLAQANVEYVCTSDRFLDDVTQHAALGRDASATRLVPSLRADDALDVEAADFPAWVARLGEATGIDVDGLEAFGRALQLRMDAFAAAGCGVADHAIDAFAYVPTGRSDVAALFASRLAGQALTAEQALRLRSFLLAFCAREYARRGWAMQLHLGAHRHTSSRLRRVAGPAGGYAAIGGATDVPSLCHFLDDLERDDRLPRTILFNANPADYAPLATLTGSFTQEGVAGKVQVGPAWWFNDHDLGIRQQLETLSRYGVLSTFVGMATDSRSLLSMSRHDYFRRVFCDFLAGQAEAGLFPADEVLLAGYVRRVCYENARRWFVNPSPTTPL